MAKKHSKKTRAKTPATHHSSTKQQSHTHVIKRKGHKERFDERKVFASVYAACMSGHMDRKKCEGIAAKVTDAVKRTLKGKKEVTSDTVFRAVVTYLAVHDKEIAFLYETHLDVS